MAGDMGSVSPTFNPLDPKTWLPMPTRGTLVDTGTPQGDQAALQYGMVPVPDVHVYNGWQGLASLGQGIAQSAAKSHNMGILNQVLQAQNTRQKASAAALENYANGGVAVSDAAAPTAPPIVRGMAGPVPQNAPPTPALPPPQAPVSYTLPPAKSPDARPAIMGSMAVTQPAPAANPPKGMAGAVPASQASASPVPSTTVPVSAPPDARMDEVKKQIAAIDTQIRAASRLFADPANAAYANAEVTRLQQVRNQYNQILINQMDPQIRMKQRAEEMQLSKAEYDLAAQKRDQTLMDGILARRNGTAPPAAPASSNGTPNTTPPTPSTGAAPASTGDGQMPPATFPGGMNAQPGVQTSMVPLSQQARDAQDLLEIGALRGNRGMVQGAQDILAADPTYEARKKQAVDMGADAAQISAKRRAGINILRSYAQLQHSFENTPDDILKGAIGPYATAPYGKPGILDSAIPSFISPNVEGMTPPQAAAAYPYTLNRLYGDPRAWDTQNLFQHDVHGLTNALMTGGGKGLNMSDERQKAFDATMRDFMKATTREKAAEVLGHAKTIIMNDFHLTQEEAEQAIQSHLEEIKAAGGQAHPAKAAPEGAIIDGATLGHPGERYIKQGQSLIRMK